MSFDIGHQERVTYNVRLNCEHELTFVEAPPMKGDVMWCVRCDAERVVVLAPHEARARCRACPYYTARHAYVSGARRAALQHRASHAGHPVTLYLGNDRVEVVGVILALDSLLDTVVRDVRHIRLNSPATGG